MIFFLSYLSINWIFLSTNVGDLRLALDFILKQEFQMYSMMKKTL